MKRGAKKKDFLDRLIPKIWYYSVRARSSWSDADLDVEFVHDPSGQKYTKTYRSRAFEAIRKHGRNPSIGKHNLRNFDLVSLVDAHPVFHGTAEVMRSHFWRLLKCAPQSLDQATKLVEDCLNKFNLRRLDGVEEMMWRFECWSPQPLTYPEGIAGDIMGVFEYKLYSAIDGLPLSLDFLALLGAMYRESALSFHLDNAKIIGKYFDKYLRNYCSEPWIREVGADLEDLARQRVLYGEMDYFPNQEDAQWRFYCNPTHVPTGIVIKKSDSNFYKCSFLHDQHNPNENLES